MMRSACAGRFTGGGFLGKFWTSTLVFMTVLFGSASVAMSDYITVDLSTSAPSGLTDQFIAQATRQFQIGLYVNPLFAGLYQMRLYGTNPSYIPPVTNQDLLNAIVSVDSFTYVYGWANGESYQQSQDANVAEGFTAYCSSATYFGLVDIDSTTCLAVALGMVNSIYRLQLSTPTTVPGEWQ